MTGRADNVARFEGPVLAQENDESVGGLSLVRARPKRLKPPTEPPPISMEMRFTWPPRLFFPPVRTPQGAGCLGADLEANLTNEIELW